MPKSPSAKKKSDEGTKEKQSEKKKLSEEDYEKKIVELEKTGLTSEKIGESLRKEGIHSKEHEKISKILKKHNIYIGPDVKNAERKLRNIEAHYSKNKQDKEALKQKEKIFGNLMKLKKYYEKRQ